jgi:ankyrin repeat protein
MTVTASPLSKLFNLIVPGSQQRLNNELLAVAGTRHGAMSPDAMWSKLHGLLRKGAQIDAVDANGNSALLLLCQEGYNIPAQRFLEHGASLGPANKAGTTAFLMAALGGEPDVLKGFVARGVNVAESDLQNSNAIDTLLSHVPLRFASDQKHTEQRVEAMRVLLGAGVELKPNARMRIYRHKQEYLKAVPDLQRIHELGQAATTVNTPKIRAALATGVHPDAAVPYGDASALSSAARAGDEELIEKALAAGADINLTSTETRLTALQNAVLYGQRDAFLKLLDLGADPAVPNTIMCRPNEDPLFGLARQSKDKGMPAFVAETMIDRDRDKHLSLQSDVKVTRLRFKTKDAPQ